ncbi:hypothetical protein PLESTB_000838800 [Pleodorina starrii]|uniref:Protein kinase domain-containing protein n=1 Tax=Pleodorina starrii TaxID=330485 RepID=A0A9W6F3E7_9CHLO|nr:hypothetical protein PLESTB_000838800 [Pleodorina starrii]
MCRKVPVLGRSGITVRHAGTSPCATQSVAPPGGMNHLCATLPGTCQSPPGPLVPSLLPLGSLPLPSPDPVPSLRLLLHYPPPFPTDMFAVGCLLAELATGQPLFPGRSVGEQLRRMMRLLRPRGQWGPRGQHTAPCTAAEGMETAAAAAASAAVNAPGNGSPWADVLAAVDGRSGGGGGGDGGDGGAGVLRLWLLRQLLAGDVASVRLECAVPRAPGAAASAAAAATAKDDGSPAAAADANQLFADLVESCLHLDPTRRPTAEQALQMPYFESYCVASSSGGRAARQAAPGQGAAGAATAAAAAAAAGRGSRRATSEVLSPGGFYVAPLVVHDSCSGGCARQQTSRLASSSLAEAASLQAPGPRVVTSPASASTTPTSLQEHSSGLLLLDVPMSAPLLSLLKMPLDAATADPRVGATSRAPIAPPPARAQHSHASCDSLIRRSSTAAMAVTAPIAGGGAAAMRSPVADLRPRPRCKDARSRDARGSESALDLPLMLLQSSPTLAARYQQLQHQRHHHHQRRHSPERRSLPTVLLQRGGLGAASLAREVEAEAGEEEEAEEEEYDLIPPGGCAVVSADPETPCAAADGAVGAASSRSGRIASGPGPGSSGPQHRQQRPTAAVAAAAAAAAGSQRPTSSSNNGRLNGGGGGSGSSSIVRRAFNPPPPLQLGPDGSGAAPGGGALRDSLSPTTVCRTSATAAAAAPPSPRPQLPPTPAPLAAQRCSHSGPLHIAQMSDAPPQQQQQPQSQRPGGSDRSPRRSSSESQLAFSSAIAARDPSAWPGFGAVPGAARGRAQAPLLGPQVSADEAVGHGLGELDTAAAAAGGQRKFWPTLSKLKLRSGRWSASGGYGTGGGGGAKQQQQQAHHYTDSGGVGVGGGGGRGPLPRLLNVLQRELIAQQQYPSYTISGGGGGGGGGGSLMGCHTPSSDWDVLGTLSEACESSCDEMRLPVLASVTQPAEGAAAGDAVQGGGGGAAATAASGTLLPPGSQRHLAAVVGGRAVDTSGSGGGSLYDTAGLSPAAAARAKGLAQRARARLRQYFSDDGRGGGDGDAAAAAAEGDARPMRSSVPGGGGAAGGAGGAGGSGEGGAGKGALMSTISRALGLGASIRGRVTPAEKKERQKQKKQQQQQQQQQQ